jgi:hypothetical protein
VQLYYHHLLQSLLVLPAEAQMTELD